MAEYHPTLSTDLSTLDPASVTMPIVATVRVRRR